MKRLLIGIAVALTLLGCGQSYEETKRLTKAQQMKLAREDSAALKIAVMPTLDCLPLFVARERQLFDTAVDIRLKRFTAQMDCDTALLRGRVEGAVTDLVRAERMKRQGLALEYTAATNAYWLLLSNHNQRITDLKHLDDKMLAMTRYSVTDMLADLVVDSAKLKTERVFRIQVNDVNVRLRMLENNEMDALFLTEPQATQALLGKHRTLLDTRRLDMRMGVLAFRSEGLDHPDRQRQMEAMEKGWNAACDSINQYGVRHYKDVVRKYCEVSEQALDMLPDSLHYDRIGKPRDKDIERARKWATNN